MRVADTGTGIAPDQQAGVFEPFVQAEGRGAGARGERAGLPGAGWRVHGLGEIGHALRQETDGILEAYNASLRADPAEPGTRAMPQAHLEDHAVTLLADLAQSLVILADAGDEAAALMADGTAIRRTVAEHHGARRFAQGWMEAAVERDHATVREVVACAVRARVTSHAGVPTGVLARTPRADLTTSPPA